MINDIPVLERTTASVDSGATARGPRTRRLGWAAAAISLLQGAVMYLLSMRGDFYADDFINYSIAHQNRASLHYLAISNFGHFQPGLRAMFLFFERVLPFHYDVVRLAMVALDVAAMLALWRLLTLLIGSSLLTLVLLAVFGFSTAMLTGNLWLTAGINNLAMLLPLILSLDGHARWMVHRRTRDLLLAAVPLGVALTFYEKPLLFVLYLPLLLVLLFAERLQPAGVLSTLRRAWPLWALDAVILAPYLYYSLRHPFAAPKPPDGLGAYLDGTARSWFFGVVPNGLGGPLQWFDFPGSMTMVPTAAAAAVHQVVAGLVIAATLLLRRGALRWWLFLAVVVISNAVLIVHFRASVFGTGIAADPRYLVDTAMLLVVVIGLAAVGPRIGPHADDPRWRENPATRLLGVLRGSAWRRRAVAGVAVAATGAAFAVPALHQADRWQAQDAAIWLNNVRSGLASAPAGLSIWDVDMPGGMLNPVFSPYNTVSHVLSLVDRGAVFDQWQAETWVPTNTGRLVRASYVVDARGSTPQAMQANSDPPPPFVAGATCISAHGGINSMRTQFDHTIAPGTYFLVFPFRASQGTVMHVAAFDAAGHEIEAAADLVTVAGDGMAVIRLLPVPITALRVDMLSAGWLCAGAMTVGHATG